MKRFDRLKTAFLVQVSHKLKTPLTSLSLGLEEMERYAANLHPGDPCHQRLSSMREDMAQFSRVILSFLRMQEVMVRQAGSRISCDVAEIVRQALDLVESKTGQHRIVLDLAELPLMLADYDRLSFALLQVLDNAFKFSRPGDTVAVSLGQEEGKIRIIVQDHGCGIAREHIPRIFDMSYQVDPDGTGQVPGFGLGLFCAREIIRQHDGLITVESRVGTGTKVTITLPCCMSSSGRSVTARLMAGGCCACELFTDGLVLMPTC